MNTYIYSWVVYLLDFGSLFVWRVLFVTGVGKNEVSYPLTIKHLEFKYVLQINNAIGME